MLSELLYATNNPGKKTEVTRLLNNNRITVLTPSDLGISLDVPENGRTLEENATQKVLAWMKVAGDRLVLSDDTGIEIDSLGGQPGIHVRRWKDSQTRMEDEEIIQYCLKLMSNVPLSQRGAQFRTVLAVGIPGGKVEIFDGTLRGVICKQAANFRVKGFPFESLFSVPEWGSVLLGQVHQSGGSQNTGRLNHRERALQKAIPRIKEFLEK